MRNLRTAVVDREGQLARRFDGNAWTAEALVEALAAVSKRRSFAGNRTLTRCQNPMVWGSIAG